MCGIAGLLTESRPDGRPVDGADQAGAWLPVLRRMMAAQGHRGPDGEGLFSDGGPGQAIHLGHRRLDIIAPGPVGAQPMTSRDGRHTLVFNGALYNFVELAAELGVPPAVRASDTAVLLAAWAAWGPDCLGRLNGMFAFAVWDAVERALYLARDRFGEKPLFCVTSPRSGVRLLFASEAKALFASGLIRPDVDRDPLAEFLATHSVDHRQGADDRLDGATLFRGVLQVPAGCFLRVGPGDRGIDLRPRRYFFLSPPARHRPLDRALCGEVRELLGDAVALRLRSDVALGGSLSGGLDSSLLAALAARAPGTRYRVFTCQFPTADEPGDESSWAEQVVQGLDLSDVVRVRPDVAGFARDLESVLFHQEAPFADTSVCAHFALMRAVRESGVKVILSGQGGDEVFAGYGSYYYALLGALLAGGALGELRRHLLARATRTGESPARLLAGAAYHAMPDRLRQHLYKHRRDAGYPLSADGERLLAAAPPRFSPSLLPLCRGPRRAWSGFDRYLIDCMARWALPHILRHDDRNSMAFGVESRAPYLDPRLTELLLTVEPSARIGDGYTKRLLREVAAGLLPEPVRLRIDKRGFFSPQRDWLWACEEAIRAACDPLPGPLAELTDRRGLARLLDGFFHERRGELGPMVFSAYVVSLFLGRTVPRLARPDMGI